MNSSPENPEAVQPVQQEFSAPIAEAPLAEPVSVPLQDPAWSGWDLVGLLALTIVLLVVSMLATLLVAKKVIYPHAEITVLARNATVIVAGQGIGYLLVFVYMYLLVRLRHRRTDFLKAIHWNFPFNPGAYLVAGAVLSLALQLLAHLLPMPKNLPIDSFFRTPAEAWMLTIFGVTLAPVMEELLFRGFLYPVLKRHLGLGAAVVITAFGFALLHGSQLKFSWGPLLVIFLVGLVLTIVRAQKDSVAASLLMHVAYNATLSSLMFIATDGFRHLERLNQ